MWKSVSVLEVRRQTPAEGVAKAYAADALGAWVVDGSTSRRKGAAASAIAGVRCPYAETARLRGLSP